MPTLGKIITTTSKAGSVLLVLLISMFLTNGLYKSALFFSHSISEDVTPAPAKLSSSESAAQQQALVKRAMSNMVRITGGEFTMGAENCDDYKMLSMCAGSPVYPVKLNDYSLARYKITNADFDIYLKAHQQYRNPYGKDQSYAYQTWQKRSQIPHLPAHLSWQQAEDYCQWLGKQSGQPVHLPTEAQWEYAARNRGQQIGFMTNNGAIEPGKNVPDYDSLAENMHHFGSMNVDVGLFPPNPLGIYDLSGNGVEWIFDNYQARKEDKTVVVDPTGPATLSYTSVGPAKVTRPLKGVASESGIGVTVHDRSYAGIQASASLGDTLFTTARCAIWSH